MSEPGYEIRKIHPPGVASAPTSGFVPAVVWNEFVLSPCRWRTTPAPVLTRAPLSRSAGRARRLDDVGEKRGDEDGATEPVSATCHIELVEISVVDLVPTHRVVERTRDVDPDRAVFLAKIVGQVGPRHQIEPDEAHASLPSFTVIRLIKPLLHVPAGRSRLGRPMPSLFPRGRGHGEHLAA